MAVETVSSALDGVLLIIQCIVSLFSVVLLFLTIHKVVCNPLSFIIKVLLIWVAVSSSTYSSFVLIVSMFILIKNDLSLFESTSSLRRNIYNFLVIGVYLIYFVRFCVLFNQKCSRSLIVLSCFLLFLFGSQALYIATNWYLIAIILVLLFHVSMVIMLSMYIRNVNYLFYYIDYNNSNSSDSDADDIGYEEEEKQITQDRLQLNTISKKHEIDKVISIILIGIIITIINFISTFLLILLEIHLNRNDAQKWLYHLNGTISCSDSTFIMFCLYTIFTEQTTISHTKLCLCLHKKCKDKFIRNISSENDTYDCRLKNSYNGKNSQTIETFETFETDENNKKDTKDNSGQTRHIYITRYESQTRHIYIYETQS